MERLPAREAGHLPAPVLIFHRIILHTCPARPGKDAGVMYAMVLLLAFHNQRLSNSAAYGKLGFEFFDRHARIASVPIVRELLMLRAKRLAAKRTKPGERFCAVRRSAAIISVGAHGCPFSSPYGEVVAVALDDCACRKLSGQFQ